MVDPMGNGQNIMQGIDLVISDPFTLTASLPSAALVEFGPPFEPLSQP